MYRKKNMTKYPRERREDYMDNTTYEDHSKGPNSEGNVDTMIGLKARRNLPKSTYAIKADPYESSLPQANPYDLIAPFNKTVGGKYAGSDNLDGGNVQQYANSYTSKTLNAFDFARLDLALNYRYIPRLLAPSNVPVASESGVSGYTPDYIGSGLVDMQRQSIAEATSVLQATTFTQMAINSYVVESDLPMGNATYESLAISDYESGYGAVNSELPDVIYASTSYYQLFWQEAISIVSAFNSFRLKQGTMIRSSWNRETPRLNSLFGLFNKKAFLSLLDSICLSFEGEYIDQAWVEQANLLSLMPSRRTNSIHDAVLELTAVHQHPSLFKLHLVGSDGSYVTTVFDDASLVTVDHQNDDTNITFWQAASELKRMFSATAVMKWARDNTVNSTFGQNAYYNRAVFLLNFIQDCCTTVKTQFNDIREVFDVISRTGLNSWVKKYRPSITKSTDAALFDNLIVNDVYKTVFSGATEITIDGNTKRWRSFTMWDMYDGVPSYDALSGGCFLTFSGKKIISSSDADIIKKWVPIAFYIDSTSTTVAGTTPSMVIVNRLGVIRTITPYEVTMANVQAFARLVPLDSQNGAKLRVPKLTLAVGESSPSTAESSFIINMLCIVFGYCNVGDHYYIDPDLLYVYEIELCDITNDAIRYARINSPFRGAAPEGDVIGFERFGQA